MSFDPSDQRKAKTKKEKEPDTGLEEDFKPIKKIKGKKGFPSSPRSGLDNVFGADSIDVSNMKISTKLTKRFFDF